MEHFKIAFGVLHDADRPFTSEGKANGMWTENKKIRDAIVKCQEAGLRVRHRISVPDFEGFLECEPLGKDKPLRAYEAIAESEKLKSSVIEVLSGLTESDQADPFDATRMKSGEYMDVLKQAVATWAAARGRGGEIEFLGKA
jgi:putative ATP-dependent endonuclease of OLD family